MSDILKFKSSSIQEAEDYYKTLHTSADQRKRMEGLSKFLSQYLSIPERAIKGFFWRVATTYQMQRHMASSEADNLTPAERLEGLKDILSLLKKELTKILVSPDQEPLLEEAFKNMLKDYTSKYANR